MEPYVVWGVVYLAAIVMYYGLTQKDGPLALELAQKVKLCDGKFQVRTTVYGYSCTKCHCSVGEVIGRCPNCNHDTFTWKLLMDEDCQVDNTELSQMSNYQEHVVKLQSGQNVSFRPRGNSMSPKIKSGQLVTITPTKPEAVEKGDIVLCKVKGHYYVHLVSAVQDERFQISNNHGRINGWVGANCVFGRLISVQD